MPKIAYLTMNSLEDFECYDHLTIEPMAELGFAVSEISWRQPHSWDDYDYVVIRSPWDYQDAPDAFMQLLESIESSTAVLLNPLSIVQWNINKKYLLELESKGVAIVPTEWQVHPEKAALMACYDIFSTDELIIKPAVSANADDTYRLPKAHFESLWQQHGAKFNQRECLIQPFMPAIINEGEYSLFYFNGRLSHCIIKSPKTGDFRVQEEHGGRLKLIESPEPELIAAADRALTAIPEKLLYARLDFVRHNTNSGNQFVLMEAELIEPSLYFNMDPDAPERFAKAFQAFIGQEA